MMGSGDAHLEVRLREINREFQRKLEEAQTWLEEARTDARRMYADRNSCDEELVAAAAPPMACETEDCCDESSSEECSPAPPSIDELREKCIRKAYERALSQLGGNQLETLMSGIDILLALHKIGR